MIPDSEDVIKISEIRRWDPGALGEHCVFPACHVDIDSLSELINLLAFQGSLLIPFFKKKKKELFLALMTLFLFWEKWEEQIWVFIALLVLVCFLWCEKHDTNLKKCEVMSEGGLGPHLT